MPSSLSTCRMCHPLATARRRHRLLGRRTLVSTLKLNRVTSLAQTSRKETLLLNSPARRAPVSLVNAAQLQLARSCLTWICYATGNEDAPGQMPPFIAPAAAQHASAAAVVLLQTLERDTWVNAPVVAVNPGSVDIENGAPALGANEGVALAARSCDTVDKIILVGDWNEEELVPGPAQSGSGINGDQFEVSNLVQTAHHWGQEVRSRAEEVGFEAGSESVSVRNECCTEDSKRDEKGAGVDGNGGGEGDRRSMTSHLPDTSRDASTLQAHLGQDLPSSGAQPARSRPLLQQSLQQGEFSSDSASHAVEEVVWEMADSIGDDVEDGNAVQLLPVTSAVEAMAGASAADMSEAPGYGASEVRRSSAPSGSRRGLVEVWRLLRLRILAQVRQGSGGAGDEEEGRWLWRLLEKHLLSVLKVGVVLLIAWRTCTRMVHMYRELKRADRLLRTQRQELRRLHAEVLVSRALVTKLERQVLPLAAVEAAGVMNAALMNLSRSHFASGWPRTGHDGGGTRWLPLGSVVDRFGLLTPASCVRNSLRGFHALNGQGACGGRLALMPCSWCQPTGLGPFFRCCEVSAATWGA